MADQEVVIKLKVEGLSQYERDLKKARKAFLDSFKDVEGAGGIIKQVFKNTASTLSSLVTMPFRATFSGIKNFVHSSIGQIAIGNILADVITKPFQLAFDGIQSIVGAGIGIIKKSLMEASDLQQTRIAIENIIGGADAAQRAKQLLEDIATLARETPFTFGELKGLGKDLLAFGYSAEQVVPILNSLGDTAAALGMDKLPFLIKALGDTKVKGKLMGPEMLQFRNALINIDDVMSKHLNISVAEFNRLQSEGLITYDMVEKAILAMGDAGGIYDEIMKEQSKTAAGLFSNLEDTWDAFLRMVGGVTTGGDLIEGGFLSQVAEGLVKLQKLLDDNKDKIADFAAKLSVKLGDFAESAISFIINEGPGLVDTLVKKVIPGILKFGEDAAKAFSDVLGFAKDLVDTIQDIGAFLGIGGIDLGDTNLSVESIVKLNKEMKDLGLNFEQFGKKGKDAFEKAITTAVNYDDAVRNVKEEYIKLTKANDESTKAVDMLSKSIPNVGNSAKNSFGAATGNAWGLYTAEIENIKAVNMLSNNAFNMGSSFAAGANVAVGQLNRISQTAGSIAVQLTNLGANTALKLLGFEKGGFIPKAQNGTILSGPAAGDQKAFRANGGEMVINQEQQSALLQILRKLSEKGSGVVNNIGSVSFGGGSRSREQEVSLLNELLM